MSVNVMENGKLKKIAGNAVVTVATTEKTGIVKPDGVTVTIDEDGTIHGSDTPATMVGATQSSNGVGGIVPAPKAGEQGYFLRGDGKWAKMPVTPNVAINPVASNDVAKLTVTWEDPKNVVVNGETLSTWQGTKLVMKEAGYPSNESDGTLLVNNTTRNAYKNVGYDVTGLTNNKTYYFALFPYSTDGIYNYQEANRFTGKPGVKIVTFADGTDDEIAAMVLAHYRNEINLSDHWSVGDKRSVQLSAMAATGVSESHRAQTVWFAIADFDHDDLTTAINGHTKAAVTLTQVDCLMDLATSLTLINGSEDTENGYMNSTKTNNTGWTSCARRTWCNDVYFNALPSMWRNMVKTVNKKTSRGEDSFTIWTTQDKVFLLAEVEITSYTNNTYSGEGTQYAYYVYNPDDLSNRKKKPSRGTSASQGGAYWLRSPKKYYSNRFCYFLDTSVESDTADDVYGIAPCICI